MSVELTVNQWKIEVSGPVAVQSVTTERSTSANVSVVGVQGPTGASGASVPPHEFAWGNVSPALVHTVTGPSLFFRVTIRIRTAFNGVNPTISVGTLAQPELFVAASDNIPAQPGDYEVWVDRDLLAGDAIYVHVNPGFGATQGSGIVIPEIFAQ